MAVNKENRVQSIIFAVFVFNKITAVAVGAYSTCNKITYLPYIKLGKNFTTHTNWIKQFTSLCWYQEETCCNMLFRISHRKGIYGIIIRWSIKNKLAGLDKLCNADFEPEYNNSTPITL